MSLFFPCLQGENDIRASAHNTGIQNHNPGSVPSFSIHLPFILVALWSFTLKTVLHYKHFNFFS